MRTHEVRRKTLDRESVPVMTTFGEVQMKVSRMNGTVLNATPEYEDCRRIAAEKGIPLKQVMAPPPISNFKGRLRNGASTH